MSSTRKMEAENQWADNSYSLLTMSPPLCVAYNVVTASIILKIPDFMSAVAAQDEGCQLPDRYLYLRFLYLVFLLWYKQLPHVRFETGGWRCLGVPYFLIRRRLPELQLWSPVEPLVVCNPIYYFYEGVDTHINGSVEAGAKYYKCYLGNRKAHYRLFKVLNNRDGPPTSEELTLARRSAQMTPEMAVQYLEKLDAISNNIKEIFEKQAAAANEPWNQEDFEELLAKWVAACAQPFSAVDYIKFCELLKYTHHPPSTLIGPTDRLSASKTSKNEKVCGCRRKEGKMRRGDKQRSSDKGNKNARTRRDSTVATRAESEDDEGNERRCGRNDSVLFYW
ncbi:hypothetical protein C8J57DRAFT_1255549 [Mycena rebaudengoi]|nr:hypothetical protein C8J57DRAFT_1255549 [Mycena rebaudengoi]